MHLTWFKEGPRLKIDTHLYHERTHPRPTNCLCNRRKVCIDKQIIEGRAQHQHPEKLKQIITVIPTKLEAKKGKQISGKIFGFW